MGLSWDTCRWDLASYLGYNGCPKSRGGIPELGCWCHPSWDRWDPANRGGIPAILTTVQSPEVGSQLGYWCHPSRDRWDPAPNLASRQYWLLSQLQRWDPSWDIDVIPPEIGGIPPTEVGSRQYSLLSQLRGGIPVGIFLSSRPG